MERYTPVIPLSEFIDYFFLDTHPDKNQWVEDFIIPTHPRMILTCCSDDTLSKEQGMLKGIYSRPVQVSTSNEIDTVIGVRFKPYGLYTGFGIDGDKVSNTIVPSTLLIEDNPLLTNYSAAEDRLQVIQKLNDTLYRILRPKKLLLEIQEMISILVTCNLTNDSQKYLAATFERSPKSFIATFKTATGFTPIKYLHIQKIEQAKNLILHNKELPLAEIGYSLGFYDQPHFIRTFRQHTGFTPKEFRKKYTTV